MIVTVRVWACWPVFGLADTNPAVVVLVSAKVTEVRPEAEAVTAYAPPGVELAVKGAEATPDAFVATVIVVVLLLNRPDAPVFGAAKVTFTPETGLFAASLMVTASALGNAVLIFVDCGVVPAFAVIEEAVPAIFVSEKLTVARPVDAAVTV